MNILFVCTGNTCRSPMAEHLLRKLLADVNKTDITVSSAGISPTHGVYFPEEARQALASEGVGSVRHTSREVTSEMMRQADLVLVMEPYHRDVLRRRFPGFHDRIHVLKEHAGTSNGNPGISDPFGQPLSVYKETLEEIRDALRKIIEKIA